MSSVAEREAYLLRGWFVKVTEVLVLAGGGSAVCVCMYVCISAAVVSLSFISCQKQQQQEPTVGWVRSRQLFQ